MINLRKFETEAQYDAYSNSEEYIEPFVGLVNENDDVHYNKKQSPLGQYLAFNITTPGYINWACMGESAATIEYSKNGGEWTEITATQIDPQEMTGGTKIDVVYGDTVQFRGNNDTYADVNNGAMFGTFAFSTCGFELEGNIMSLIDSTNFSSITAMTTDNNGAFASMFAMCTGLTSAENLVLPTTTLANTCYYQMFYHCSSLTTAPELPATTLARACYFMMFLGCTSLTTAPELPATTLVERCYDNMFNSCTSLNYIKCLATDISVTNCTSQWVNGVASSGTFVKNPNMSSWTRGDSGIPINWTVQDAS